MITTTGRDLCNASLRLLGVVGDGLPMKDAQLSPALDTLNSFLDSLGTQPQSMYTVTRSVTTCAAFAASYTIGPGGTFNMARPVQINGAGYIVPGTSGVTTQEAPLFVITDDMYQWNKLKSLQNPLPTTLYYNPTNTTAAGFGTISLWPVLDQSMQIVLYVQQFLAQFPDTTTDVVLVTGLHRMLTYNLAKELLPSYGQTNPLVVQAVLATAAQSMADYKRSNVRMSDLPNDASVIGSRRGFYNIQTGNG